MDEFLNDAQEKIKDVERSIEVLLKDISEIRILFGEDAMLPNPGDDPCSAFFTLFCDTMKKYANAYKQTLDWRETASVYFFISCYD